MSETNLISPLLDGFVMGAPMSDHDGVRCCPAMKENSDDKFIVKIISVPASQRQLDALLLTGAYKDAASAMAYFKEQADSVVTEAEFLQQMAKLEGFLPYDRWQTVPMENNRLGYEIYLISPYKRSLEKFTRRNAMTHLGAVNLGLDLCAALAVCRRAGYIYADLKPGNIFITEDKEYRIGDLGFLSLDALKYTALPAKYCSRYTAPELHDPMATINTTLDTYAVGLILYQIYNGGKLPFKVHAPAEALPAPVSADAELAEIILKAVDPDPQKRWKDPIEMGQALVAYMQRSVINDEPIPVPQEEPAPQEEEEDLLAGNPAAVPADAAPEAPRSPDGDAEPVREETEPADAPKGGVLTLQKTQPEDDEDPDDLDDDLDDDDLEDDEDDIQFLRRRIHREKARPIRYDDDDDDDDDEEEPADDGDDEDEPRRRSGWLAPVIIILVLLLLCSGAFYYYQNFFLLPINKLEVDGTMDSLTVRVDTDIDETNLYVVCTDTYGNTQSAWVVDGKTTFSGLTSDTLYKIQVEIKGFHQLSGSTFCSYTTAAQTKIVDFTAITGTEDGSAILNFTVEGPEAPDWTVTYSAEGEEPRSVTFSGHMVTIGELTVGKVYTFDLAPASELYISGNTTLEFTASQIVIAETVDIVSVSGNALTAVWTAPEGAQVDSWTVRCYSDGGYDETVTTAENTAVFENIDTTKAYTVEVTAGHMTQSARAYLTANPISIKDFKVTETEDGTLEVTWSHEGTAPEDGWLLLYSMGASESQEVIKTKENKAVIPAMIPNTSYSLSLQTPGGVTVFGGFKEYKTSAAALKDMPFESSQIELNLCKAPNQKHWGHAEVKEKDYTTSLKSGDPAGLMVKFNTKFYTDRVGDPKMMFVIRDTDGAPLADFISTTTLDWTYMYNYYCGLTIPAVPTAAGDYILEVYMNGGAVGSVNFTITE